MSKLTQHQKYSIYICALPIFALTISYFTKSFRYSEYRSIYLISLVIVYLLWIISLTWSLINSVYILQMNNLKNKIKFTWAFLSLLPIIYIVIMLSIALLRDY